jgi:LuxR family maltose regulon positive regulatory protein
MLPGKSATTSSLSPYYVEPLSDREVEVLRLLQGTATNEQIAQRLFISVNTLRSHMKSINRKLAASDRRDAVRRARELSIL